VLLAVQFTVPLRVPETVTAWSTKLYMALSRATTLLALPLVVNSTMIWYWPVAVGPS